MISLHGVDARLTSALGRQIDSSRWGELLIAFCNEFQLQDGVIFLDHLQGLVSGDLNSSDTATAICREANKIASATGSAVVFLSHTSKAHLKTGSNELDQGFASGSLAFENAMRQTIGLVTMTEEEAKIFGLQDSRKDYVWLGLPKNSYGGVGAGVWLKKTPNKQFHTVTTEPVVLSPANKTEVKTATERIIATVVEHLASHHWTTRNAIEKLAGTRSKFKASAKALRRAIDAGLESGQLELHAVTVAERSEHALAKQVKEVLRAAT
jgi:RecA-family ATPase